jgi:hypothetical protein
LLGEILNKLNLFLGERTYFSAVDEKCADQLVPFEHWHRNRRARTTVPNRRTQRVFSRSVHEVNHLFILTKATKQLTGHRCKRPLSGEEIGIGGRHVVHCCRMKQATFKKE